MFSVLNAPVILLRLRAPEISSYIREGTADVKTEYSRTVPKQRVPDRDWWTGAASLVARIQATATREGWGAGRLDHTRGTISPRAKTLPTQRQPLLWDTNVAHSFLRSHPRHSFAWSTPSEKLYVRTRPNTLLLDRSVMQESRICFQLSAQPRDVWRALKISLLPRNNVRNPLFPRFEFIFFQKSLAFSVSNWPADIIQLASRRLTQEIKSYCLKYHFSAHFISSFYFGWRQFYVDLMPANFQRR